MIKSILRFVLPRPIRKRLSAWDRRAKRFFKVELFVFLRRMNLLPFSRYKGLKKYRNIHKGERCFIVVTGPSLTIDDINKLKNEYTFSMNSIALSFKDTSWRPTYYAIQDPVSYRALVRKGGFGLSDVKDVFISHRVEEAVMSNRDDFPYEYNVFPLDAYRQFIVKVGDSRKYAPSPYKIKFSGNVYAAAYGDNIAYSVLQIAVHMGFSEIYLLGCDCDFEVGKQNYLVDYSDDYEMQSRKVDQLRYVAAVENLFLAYRSAKEYADKHGIKIYNATRGGKLEVFERVDLDEVLAKTQ